MKNKFLIIGFVAVAIIFNVSLKSYRFSKNESVLLSVLNKAYAQCGEQVGDCWTIAHGVRTVCYTCNGKWNPDLGEYVCEEGTTKEAGGSVECFPGGEGCCEESYGTCN